MQTYRLYFVDLLTDRVQDFHEFEADNDDAAMVESERRRGDGSMELWCRDRRIVKWPALLC